MFSTYGVFPLLILMAVCSASEQNTGRNDIQTYRSIGLEEMALFLIGQYENDGALLIKSKYKILNKNTCSWF